MIVREDCVNADPDSWPCRFTKGGKCPEDCDEYHQKLSEKERKVREQKMKIRTERMQKNKRRPSCIHGVPLLKTCQKCKAEQGGKDGIRKIG